MDLGKTYYDTEENEINILQLVKREPEWAANQIQEYEKVREKLKLAKRLLLEAKQMMIDYGNEKE